VSLWRRAPAGQHGCMFVRYFVEVRLPAERVEAALIAAAEAWLPAVAVDASDHGERLLAVAGAGAATSDRVVEVELGTAVRFPSKLAMPISWRPAGGGAALPALDADIEVGTLGPDHTQLAVNCRYTRPAGRRSASVDRFLLHRVAEATMKRFLDEVASRVADGNGARRPTTVER